MPPICGLKTDRECISSKRTASRSTWNIATNDPRFINNGYKTYSPIPSNLGTSRSVTPPESRSSPHETRLDFARQIIRRLAPQSRSAGCARSAIRHSDSAGQGGPPSGISLRGVAGRAGRSGSRHRFMGERSPRTARVRRRERPRVVCGPWHRDPRGHDRRVRLTCLSSSPDEFRLTDQLSMDYAAHHA